MLHLYGGDSARVPVRVDLDARCPRILGDAQQLRQVLHNLLQNAQDATETAGRSGPEFPVTVRTQWVEASGRVRLSVLDYGTGFPEPILKRAFEPYVTTKAKGTGLGLAVVKKIADEHGARIDLANRLADEPGGGGTSIVIIRCRETGPGLNRTAPRETQRSNHGKHTGSR